jgi:hypothetical protein
MGFSKNHIHKKKLTSSASSGQLFQITIFLDFRLVHLGNEASRVE